jgi:16S rRNA (cytosine1402-N4)-methyltransferase
MRYDPVGQFLTAAQIVNNYSEEQLARVFFEYGEEPRARVIARHIVQRRPINTTRELADLVSRIVRPRRSQRIHPATRVFQALRIAVNNELSNIQAGLEAAIQLLVTGGRLVVISYHSLEDRLVKNRLAGEAATCVCPPELPVCVCQHQATVRLVQRRIIRPGTAEVAQNPRSRSARMRVAERL